MITATKAEALIWKWVNDSPLKSAINGGVYRNVRPTSSTKEDVVINSISTTGSESLIQDSRLNVNVHVPAILVGGNTYVPNQQRFDAISEVISLNLKEGFNSNFTFWVEQTQLIQVPSTNDWYLNIRIKLKFHNNI